MAVPIYLINLERDRARLALMQVQLSRLGLEFARVEAVDGLNMPAWLHPYFVGHDGRTAGGLLPGEVGCYASHLLVCSMVAASGVPSLVLEDDLEIADGFQALLQSFAGLPDGWDIVRLSNPFKRGCVGVAELTDRFRLVKFSRVPPSTGAYFLSPSGARKFLQWKRLRDLPVDQDLRRTWECGLRTFGVYPQPVASDIGFSTIDAMNRRPSRRRRATMRLQDHLKRAWHDVGWLGVMPWLAGQLPTIRYVREPVDSGEPLARSNRR